MQFKNKEEQDVDKFKKLVEEVRICMFTTLDDKNMIESRPMSTASVDDEGNIWFFSNEHSEKVNEVQDDNPVVNLLYSHPGTNTYLNVRGTCSVMHDRAKMKELWSPLLKAWFPDGIDDPRLCLLKVSTEEAAFWNSSSNKMKVMFQMVKAAVTGDRYDEGDTGNFNLK